MRVRLVVEYEADRYVLSLAEGEPLIGQGLAVILRDNRALIIDIKTRQSITIFRNRSRIKNDVYLFLEALN